MNFARATLSLSLALTAATGAQARAMRATAPGSERDLVEDDLKEKLADFATLSTWFSSMSMPAQGLDTADAELEEGSVNSAAAGQERFNKSPLGVAIAAWKAEAEALSSGTAAVTEENAANTFNTASKAGKSAGVCGKRFDRLKDRIEDWMGTDESDFVTKAKMDAACSRYGYNAQVDDDDFDFPSDQGISPNYGCPVLPYYGDGIGFLLTRQDYINWFFWEETGNIYYDYLEYCDCHQAYELGCAAKIAYPELALSSILVDEINVKPGETGPKKFEDYCLFAGMWNFDLDVDDVYHELSEDVTECGCYFVHQANYMLTGCPGVELFWNYNDA